MKSLRLVGLAAIVAVAAMIAGAAAQTPISTSSGTQGASEPVVGVRIGTPAPPRLRVERATLAPLTEQLADWLIAELESAVTISRIGEEQAASRRVRRFASDVADEHQALLDELITLRGGKRARASAGGAAPAASVPADNGSSQREEAPQTRPIESSKTAASGSGQESGPTGVRSRDVAPGETGANLSVGGGDKQPGDYTAANPASSEPSSGKTATEEMRARDRRLDAFDRAGQAWSAKQAEQIERQKIRVGQNTDSPRRTQEQIAAAQIHTGIGNVLQDLPVTRLAIVRNELDDASDDEFDRVFLNQQVELQMHLLSVFRSINRHSSAELRGISADGAHVSRKFMESAKALSARQ